MQIAHRKYIIRTAVIALAAALANVPVPAQDVSCFSCHEDQKSQFAQSAHSVAGLLCTDCHGGNPKVEDLDAHETEDFRRPKDKRELAESCATCHSDVRKMNAYGLPTDQLARYKTSRHGEQLYEKNDQNVAACTDCHGTHDIQKARSPQSRTYPANIPKTCGECHSNKELMAKYKLPSDVTEQYQASYHAQMLFEKGDLSAPTCVTCHGNHGATPPGTAVVGQVCGKCHVRQRDLFNSSPHAELASMGAFGECIDCHGNHAIEKASIKLLSQSCVNCHAEGDKAMAVRDSIEGILHKTRNDYQRAGALVHEATVRGMATDDQQMLLQEALTQLTDLEALQHAISADQLKPAASRAAELLEQTLDGIAALERIEHWKRLSLAPILLFLGVMTLLFWLKRKELEQSDV